MCGTLISVAMERKDEEGWICPRCGKVNAPFVGSCDCKSNIVTNMCCGSDHDWRLISAGNGTNGACYTYRCRKCGATKDVYDNR